ncbi:hypothetical protein CRE_22949 [Caenorhabditis remanei]|uniref:RING-type domain-containing protein n=1 Tax=Caenorhabditis remanei TaxID=31234 RepID=E3MVZ5_CAERE|nr:hypothetical protein CRE_22949 [Caenorhabditis remanei]
MFTKALFVFTQVISIVTTVILAYNYAKDYADANPPPPPTLSPLSLELLKIRPPFFDITTPKPSPGPPFTYFSGLFIRFFPTVIMFLWLTTVCADRQTNTPQIQKTHRNVIFGYGGIMVCSVISQLVVMVWRNDLRVSWVTLFKQNLQKIYFETFYLVVYSTLLMFNLSPIPFFLFFICDQLPKYEIKKCDKANLFKLKIAGIQLFISLFLSLLFLVISGFETSKLIFMVTIWYTVFFSAAISEFCAICEYGIQLRDEGERIGVYEQQERGGAIIYRYVGVSINPDIHIFFRPAYGHPHNSNIVETKQIEDPAPEKSRRYVYRCVHKSRCPFFRPPGSGRRTTMASMIAASGNSVKTENEVDPPTVHLNCKVCTQPYSTITTVTTPRILVRCGHTVCQGCIQNLMDPQQHQVICPFCRKDISVPDGLVEELPKNFAILELVEKEN